MGTGFDWVMDDALTDFEVNRAFMTILDRTGRDDFARHLNNIAYAIEMLAGFDDWFDRLEDASYELCDGEDY